jgi:hypothetical protein
MTMQYEITDDVLGLAGTFPRPGWVVLDAIRERRYTGEVRFSTSPEVAAYADGGRIYLAERVDDPTLGARLVDAGALSATQLEHGAMRVGDGEYLGRLFERVPSVDRHQVLVMADLMTDECLGWIAGQRISNVDAVPYRHHPSGARRWDQAFVLNLAPGDPLPAPAPDSAPVDLGPPEPLFKPTDSVDADDMIFWNEPSWLDEQLRPIDVAGRLAALRAADVDVAVAEEGDESATIVPTVTPTPADDWIARLDTHGLPEAGSDPLAAPVRLAPLGVEQVDRFELIWPSGDIDEEFGGRLDEPNPHPDIDRAGPTARLVRDGTARLWADPSPSLAPPEPRPSVDEEIEHWLADEAERDLITDEVVLAVRRAVASIETGSLAARRRLADVSSDPELPALPGRVAVRSDSPDVVWSARSVEASAGAASVFDTLPEPGSEVVLAPPPTEAAAEPQRTSALRKLIGSIRRR